MEELAFQLNAYASYEDIEENGPPSDPLMFDQASVGVAERVDARVYDPATDEVLEASNIIYEHHPDGRPPERAYWLRRKLSDCIFGVVKACEIVKFRNSPDAQWEITGHMAAVKIMSWERIRTIRHVEDPLNEVAAMQLVSSDGVHPHVMGALDVLQNKEALLLFMPFCSRGRLIESVQKGGRFPEPVARYFFRQILEVCCSDVFLCRTDLC
jgi:serine/threonine protein kinase